MAAREVAGDRVAQSPPNGAAEVVVGVDGREPRPRDARSRGTRSSCRGRKSSSAMCPSPPTTSLSP